MPRAETCTSRPPRGQRAPPGLRQRPARPGGPDVRAVQAPAPCHSAADFPAGAAASGAPLTQGEGQEQWQGAGAAARGGPVHQPHAAGPGSPWTSPPRPAPLARPRAPEGGPGNYCLRPAGNETTSRPGTRAWAGNTRGAGGSGSAARAEGASYLSSLCLHTPQPRGAGLGRGSLHAAPTQVAPHPHPHSGTCSSCPRASSPAPPAGSHLTLRFPPLWGPSQVLR